MWKLLIYVIYLLITIVLIVSGYNYYVQYRNCITPFKQLQTFPSICTECDNNDIVRYIKSIDKAIYKNEYHKNIMHNINLLCYSHNLPCELKYYILQYINLDTDCDPDDNTMKIHCCCKKCYNKKYLNKTVKPWEIWNYFDKGFIPKDQKSIR